MHDALFFIMQNVHYRIVRVFYKFLCKFECINKWDLNMFSLCRFSPGGCNMFHKNTISQNLTV